LPAKYPTVANAIESTTGKNKAIFQFKVASKITPTIPGAIADIVYPTACAMIDRERVSLACILLFTVRRSESVKVVEKAIFEINNQGIKCQPSSRIIPMKQATRIAPSIARSNRRFGSFDE
jgi:hypothetical protein